MYLAFRTDCTGRPHQNLAIDHPKQPQLIRFAGVVFDEAGNDIERFITFVRPKPNTVMDYAHFVEHGVTLEQAYALGQAPDVVLSWFARQTVSAHEIIGHNVHYEIVNMAIVAAQTAGTLWDPPCPLFCTMAQSTPIVNLTPGKRGQEKGRTRPTPPTLTECYEHFFSEPLTRSDDPDIYLDALIRVFQALTGKNTSASR